MNMEEKIKAAIKNKIKTHDMQLINESHKHAGHAGDDGSGQTHFKLMIVSDDFLNLNRVQRQRLVNAAISECFDAGLHAISLKLNTCEESKV